MLTSLRTLASPSFACLALAGVLVSGCADGGTDRPRDGGGGRMDGAVSDAGTSDTGPAPVDAAADAGSDAGTDAGPGEGLECQACEDGSDCAAGSHCVLLGGDQRVCLRACEPDLPDCAEGFDCVPELLTVVLPEPVCVPVAERCCVDEDGDDYGQGVGCDGSDCDDAVATTNPGATEICNAVDDDCNGTADDGDTTTICPRAEHVATAMCTDGMCSIATCEPSYDDCDAAAPGCETSLATITDCGACGTPCALAHATATCASGACEIAVCDAGWGDCNALDADGCETELNTLTSCGACGVTCDRTNALTSCATGTCTVTGCAPTWGNCDSTATNGCETSTTTNANCGTCGSTCAPSRGAGDCSSGTCTITTCMAGWEDCDGLVSNGCETPLNTLTNCGGCGLVCGAANASASCATRSCVTSCNAGFASCDGNAANGCEANLSTLANCGGCGSVCARANAAETCAAGTCTLGACDSGFENCDGNATNGCEVGHVGSATCGGATNLGTYDGDLSCGTICGGNGSWDTFASRTGRASAWFQAASFEDSSCDADIEHRVRLQSPPGIDYDLFVYRGCGGALIGSSTSGAGALDTVTFRESDDTNGNDGITYWIEVRYFSGLSCDTWTALGRRSQLLRTLPALIALLGAIGCGPPSVTREQRLEGAISRALAYLRTTDDELGLDVLLAIRMYGARAEDPRAEPIVSHRLARMPADEIARYGALLSLDPRPFDGPIVPAPAARLTPGPDVDTAGELGQRCALDALTCVLDDACRDYVGADDQHGYALTHQAFVLVVARGRGCALPLDVEARRSASITRLDAELAAARGRPVDDLYAERLAMLVQLGGRPDPALLDALLDAQRPEGCFPSDHDTPCHPHATGLALWALSRPPS